MITKNWYNIFKMFFAGYYNAADSVGEVTTLSGTKYFAKTPSSSSSSFANAVYGFFPSNNIHTTGSVVSGSKSGVHFGSGDTPPTLDDYCLVNEITTLKGVGCSCAIHTKGNRHELDMFYTVQNTGAESVTVREVGWVAPNQVSTYSSTTNFLFDRTVLDAPVTIAPGETAVIKYTLGVTLPF